jgi:tRNA A-37 threonylcarbamoyl transferase component Bud32
VLPERRYSGFATYQGQEVFGKFFFGRRARIRWRREEAGVRRLIAAGIDTPRLAYSGEANGGYVVMTELITDAKTCRELWNEAQSEEARRDLLRGLCGVLAHHHNAGIRQTDLHWNNFLGAGGTIYTLDGAGIVAGPPSGRDALDNLALLFAQNSPRFDSLVPAAYRHYAMLRGTAMMDNATLQKRIRLMRNERARRYAKKVFRNSTALACESDLRRFVVYDRSFDTPDFRKLLVDIEAAFSGELLKKGNSSTIARVSVDGRQIVVKRYNIKTAWHGIRRALRRTRAANSWQSAQLLKFFGIATANPVALIERRFGPLRGSSYFVCEYVAGPNVRHFVASNPQDAEQIVRKLASMLSALQSQNLSHGDLKASNIIVRGEQLVLLDLDAMREYRSPTRLRRAIARDARRLLANWERGSAMYAQLEATLRGLL